MDSAQYAAMVRAWRRRERRTADRVNRIAVVMSKTHGGSLSMDDVEDEELMEDEE